MTKHTLDEVVRTAADAYRIPTLSSCTVEVSAANRLAVESEWTQLDVDRNERIRFGKRFSFEIKDDAKSLSLLEVSKPNPVRSDSWRVRSLDGALYAAISNWKDKTEDKQFLEIWNNDARIVNLNLSKLAKHEKLYDNTLVWSASATHVAYIAEIKKTRKVTSFFTNNTSDCSTGDCVTESNHEEKYAFDYTDEWGEQNVGKSQSVIAIVDLSTLDVKVVENVPQGICPSSLSWYKDDGVVFSAWYTKPYRLGLVSCPMRKSDLYYYSVKEDKCTQLTNESNKSVREPRFSSDYKMLCWLDNAANGPHFQCSRLMLMDWTTKTTSVLVDIVKETGNKFNGIFAQTLLNQCWSLDNKRIVLSTQTSHKMRIVSCDVDSRAVTVLDNGLSDLNYLECLNFHSDWVCALLQGYNKKPTVVIAKLPARGSEGQIKWNYSESRPDELELVAQVDLLQFEPEYFNPKYPRVKFEAILVQKKQKSDNLVIYPHGGPHSAYLCEFSYNVVILFQLGFSVLLVNFRGSSGYGQDNVESLPGDIGTQDVKDCHQAADFCMKQFHYKNAFLFGGSHGGFLSCHMIGQYPDFYSAAVVRNPVTHLEGMWFLSDIPDWVFYETLGDKNYFDYKYVGDSQVYDELMKKSPMKHIDSVKTPIFFCVGGSDLRVPQSQSIQFHKGLLARGKVTRLCYYKEDNHSLNRPQTSADSLLSTVLWFEKYMK